MKELEGVFVRLLKDDLDELRKISNVRGDLINHIRRAVSEYVERLKEAKQ